MRLKKTTSIIFYCLVFSLLVHFIFLIFFGKFSIPSREVLPNKSEVVFVDLPKAQPIVDIAKPHIQELPEKPSAQALYNQKVTKEEVTRQTGPTVAPQKKGAPQKPDKKIPEKPKPEKQRSQANKQESKPEEIKLPQIEPPQKIPGMPEATPSRLGGEYLPKIKIGNTTYINTLANPNVGYFVELKRRFSLTWSPINVLRPQASRLPPGAIQTMIGITVNPSGQILRVTVLKPSGIEGYDEEALRTVKSSAPYSSPPANLLENGVLNMAWTFIVHK